MSFVITYNMLLKIDVLSSILTLKQLSLMVHYSTKFTWNSPQVWGGGGKDRCCLLKESPYGLEQSGHEWNVHLTNTLKSKGFV